MPDRVDIRNKITAVRDGELPSDIVPELWCQNVDEFVNEFTQLMTDYFFEMGDTHFNRSGMRRASDDVYNYVLGIEPPKEIPEPEYDVEHFDFW
jgi:hypothetical protein